MSAAAKAIDPLWQCLCPSWSQAIFATPAFFYRHSQRASIQCLHTRRLEYSQPHLSPGVRRYTQSYKPSHTQRPARSLDLSSSKQKSQRDGTPLHPWQPGHDPLSDLRQESTHFLYGRLSTAAINGDPRRCREIAEYLVTDRREQPNVQLYNALILSNISHHEGSAWRASELLDEMKAEGLQPDVGTCHALLKVVSVHVDHLLRTDVLDHMQKRWFTLSEDGAHDVAAGLLREGLFEQALARMDKMRDEGMRIDGWLSDMAAYILCEAGEIEEAFRIMRLRFDSGNLHLSRCLWTFLLDKASEVRHHEATSFVWTSQVKQGHLNPSSGICLNILATAARAGDAALGTEVFEHLGKRGTPFQSIHYELLISTYLSMETPDVTRALSILTIMPLEKLEPTTAETRTLYLYLRDKPDLLLEAFNTLRELHEQGRKIPIAVLNLLIECYVWQNNLAEAMKIYKVIHTFVAIGDGAQKSFANAETFNLLFKGCRLADPPDDQQASFLVSELLALRIAPTAITYDRIMLVFIEAAKFSQQTAAETQDGAESETAKNRALELLDWAFQHFTDMQTQEWVPRLGTLESLAVQLARTGDDRCWDVLQVMEDRNGSLEGAATRGPRVRRNVEEAWQQVEKEVVGGENAPDLDAGAKDTDEPMTARA